MPNNLKDKVAVITGSGRGIGRTIALLMAQEGAKVVVNDLGGNVDGTGANKMVADDVVAEIKKMGGKAVATYDSVTTPEGGNNIIKAAVDAFGRIDILVNNAGILRDRMIFNMGPEEWDAVLKVHLYGVFNCTKPASVLMRQQRYGRIVSMSSSSGMMGNSGQSNYGAAKGGISAFTRVIARDLGKYGIIANAVCPAAATRMTLSAEVLEARRIRKERGLAAAAGEEVQMPEPEDNAPIVCFLCTDVAAAANINGYVFGSRGGSVDLLNNPYPPVRSIFKEGRWTVDELVRTMPQTLASGLINPAPPQAPEKK